MVFMKFYHNHKKIITLFGLIFCFFSFARLGCSLRDRHTVSGTLSGLVGELSLRITFLDVSTQTEIITLEEGDETFSFTKQVPKGVVYTVSIASQPETQDCSIANASDTMGGEEVDNVEVNCVDVEENIAAVRVSATGPVNNLVLTRPFKASEGLEAAITVCNDAGREISADCVPVLNENLDNAQQLDLYEEEEVVLKKWGVSYWKSLEGENAPISSPENAALPLLCDCQLP